MDLWAFACVLFQMLEGKPPFRAASEYLTFERILALDYEISDQVPEPAQDLIRCILKTEPSSRLGRSPQYVRPGLRPS